MHWFSRVGLDSGGGWEHLSLCRGSAYLLSNVGIPAVAVTQETGGCLAGNPSTEKETSSAHITQPLRTRAFIPPALSRLPPNQFFCIPAALLIVSGLGTSPAGSPRRSLSIPLVKMDDGEP